MPPYLKSLPAIASSGEAGGEERIARKTVDAVPNAFGIHKTLGPGLLEKVYEVCFCHELSKRGLEYQRQVDVLPIASGYMME